MPTKLEKYQRFVPGLLRPRTNVMVRGILAAWASEDDRIVQSIEDAKEQLFVITAQLQYLEALGSNVGVFKPTAFNLSDALFRKLIPALSFAPKQVVPTIQTVLDIFFGENNPQVNIQEIRRNRLEITIPSTVPALRRDLRGAQHFHSYSGTIDSIDNLGKTITVSFDEDTQQVVASEFDQAFFGQEFNISQLVSAGTGNQNVVLQFSAVEDLSVYDASKNFVLSLQNYPGSYIPDITSAFTKTKQRGTLGQTITSGSVVPTLTMEDASQIPDQTGFLGFNLGHATEESLIKYFGRPNNKTLFIDPGYSFVFDHALGEIVNVVETPYKNPRVDGSDYSVYFVGITAARLLAQEIVRSIVAAGVVVNFIILEPEVIC